jgi:hypothetical protein
MFPSAKLDDSKSPVNLLAPTDTPSPLPGLGAARAAGASIATPMGGPAATPSPSGLGGRTVSGTIGNSGDATVSPTLNQTPSVSPSDLGKTKATPIPYAPGMKPSDFKGKGLYITDPNGVVRGPT